MELAKIEVLLNYRKTLEEEAQKKLAFAQRQLLEEISKKTRLLESVKNAMEEKNEKLKVTPHSPILQLYENYFRGAKLDLVKIEERITMKKNYLEQKRLELVEAVKKRKIVDKLKEKKLNEIRKLALKRENLLLDEVGVIKFANETRK